LFFTAVNLTHPMAIRYPRGTGLGVRLDAKLHSMDIGQGEVLRNGEDVVILAIGTTVTPALGAAQILASNGIEATVVNSRFAKPLDVKLITGLARHIKYVVTVEENTLCGGFGSNVVALLSRLKSKSGVENQIKNLGLPDEFIGQGEQAILHAKYALDAQGIAREVRNLFPQQAFQSLVTFDQADLVD